MSRSGSKDESLKTEKEILTRLLKAYKDNACLWDIWHPDYTNKVRKKEVKENLLEIFKELEPNADTNDVKNKLSNMRSTGHRYFLRKIEAKSKGMPYSIPLWYYDHVKFLYGDDDDDDDDTENDTIDVDKDEQQIDPVTNTISPKYESALATELLKGTSNNYASEYINFMNDKSESNTTTVFETDHLVASSSRPFNDKRGRKRKLSEENIFGKTIGYQLSEVETEQKYIAEKLISQVVYLARMDKLTSDANISLKSSNSN